jgi:large subunit ribosomal protein L18
MGTRRRRNTGYAARKRRHARVRKRVSGTADQPRLAVFRSNTHIYAQVIDDVSGQTLAAASDLEKDLRGSSENKTARAGAVGARVAERAKGVGISSVIFDRGGFRYHGRVKALADGARDSGLSF